RRMDLPSTLLTSAFVVWAKPVLPPKSTVGRYDRPKPPRNTIGFDRNARYANPKRGWRLSQSFLKAPRGCPSTPGNTSPPLRFSPGARIGLGEPKSKPRFCRL